MEEIGIGPTAVPIPDKRVNNSPDKSQETSEENLRKTINTEIYNNIRFYLKILYDNAATETDIIILKALWREIKRLMKINGIEIEKKKQ